MLILNKFGKHESDGRGLRPVIAEALARDIPVVLGLSKLSQAVFRDFVGGAAEFVEPDAVALLAWVDESQASAGRACNTAAFLQSAL